MSDWAGREKSTMATNVADAVKKVYDVLANLVTGEERVRVVKAALQLFPDVDDVAIGGADVTGGSKPADKKTPETKGHDIEGVSSAGRTWIEKNAISGHQLEMYFDIEPGQVTPLDLFGSRKASMRDRTIACFLLAGIKNLLQDGDAVLTEEEVKPLREHFGCVDATNYSKHRKAASTYMVSKGDGYKLTNAGLSAAVAYMREAN